MIKYDIKGFKLKIGERSFDCYLPATVYSVLEGNSGIEECAECEFESVVNLTEKDVASKYVFLRISGVLADAEIIFNGRNYGIVESAERVCIFDVTDKAKVGENRLTVLCHGPLTERVLLSHSGKPSNEYELARYVPDMGLIGSVQVIATSSAIITDVRLKQVHEGGKVTVLVDVDTVGESADVRHALTLVSPSGKIYFGGISNGRGSVSVADPELWYPVGLGKPSLYKLSITLYRGAEATDTYEKEIGLRHVDLIRNDHGALCVHINGDKLFSLGATYVTERSICSKISKKETEKIIKAAVAANMNTLTVVSSPITPSEYFYDLCDKYGILVWQDIPVPFIPSGTANAFAAGVSESVRSIMSRLSAHPCIALMYLSVTQDAPVGDGLSAQTMDEYCGVCANILSPGISKYAADIPFVYSLNDLLVNDERYLSGAQSGFAPSYIASVATAETLADMLQDSDKNPFGKDIEDTAKVLGSAESMICSIARTLKFPYGEDEVIYASQLAAGYEISKSVKRARMTKGECVSAVFRQLNDPSALLSPSYIDTCVRPKAINYFASAFNAPITVAALPNEESMCFGISNNTRKEYFGRLMYALYDTDNKCHFETTRTVNISALCSQVVIEEDFSKYIRGNRSEFYVIYELSDHNGVRCADTELFTSPKRFNFKDPEIKSEIEGSGKRFSIKLSAKYFAAAVAVSFHGIDAKFDKNFVNIIPGTPLMLNFETAKVITVGELSQKLQINTIQCIGGH